jgi:hypothetical protein
MSLKNHTKVISKKKITKKIEKEIVKKYPYPAGDPLSCDPCHIIYTTFMHNTTNALA